MPKYDTLGLLDYVRKHAVNAAAADRVLEALNPFLAIDPRRAYPFARAGEIDVGDLPSIVWTALQRPMNRCWFHHVQSPLPAAAGLNAQTCLISSVSNLYGTKTGYHFVGNDDFRRVIYDALGDRLRDAMHVSSCGKMDPHHAFSPSWTVLVLLQYQTALCAMNAPEADRLLALTQQLLRAVPLAEDVNKPDSWYVTVG